MMQLLPTFSDFFKSYYHSNTYLKPVDLSAEALKGDLLETTNKEAHATAQRLISSPEVQNILSAPLSYDYEKTVPEAKTILEKHGFNLLSVKRNAKQELVPFYSVTEHPELENWVIKSGGIRVKKENFMIGLMNDQNELAFFGEEESILRLAMAKRITEVAKKANIEVEIPEKKLVPYANLDAATEPNNTYCVACRKIVVLSREETVDAIKKMGPDQQIELAKKITKIVKEVGLCDASFHNIRLTPDGKPAFIDTEPTNLMVPKKGKFCNPKGASVEKCARIGLFTLKSETLQASNSMKPNPAQVLNMQGIEKMQKAMLTPEPGLEAFHKEVDAEYIKAISPKLSKWKIVLSVVTVGLMPLILAIVALIKVKIVKGIMKSMAKRVDSLGITRNPFTLMCKSPEEQIALQKKALEVQTPYLKRLFAHIEGVPYKAQIPQLAQMNFA